MLRAPSVAVVLIVAATLVRASHAQSLEFGLFERYIEPLRHQAGIPGLSAAIVQNGRIVWERGFGWQDVEGSMAASPSTPYPVTELTQTLAATLVLQCAERAEISLDEPIGSWFPTADDPGATVRQLLAHLASGQGAPFRYSPSRYAWLTHVIEACMSEPFRLALTGSILHRLAMIDSVPGRDLGTLDAEARELFDSEALERYERVLQRLAVPYKVDRRGRASRAEYPMSGINAATGLVSTVRDLAKFDAALHDHILLRSETQQLAWTNGTVGGLPIPAGLGWLAQLFQGQRVVWHFGSAPDAYSSLIVKLPARGLTLIMLANSDGLAEPFKLADGDVTTSVFALVFLRLFA